jgi:aryl-alcohol dehydrogenase-like predicted oxidoreductase
MRYTLLGQSGLRVSELALGTMTSPRLSPQAQQRQEARR